MRPCTRAARRRSGARLIPLDFRRGGLDSSRRGSRRPLLARGSIDGPPVLELERARVARAGLEPLDAALDQPLLHAAGDVPEPVGRGVHHRVRGADARRADAPVRRCREPARAGALLARGDRGRARGPDELDAHAGLRDDRHRAHGDAHVPRSPEREALDRGRGRGPRGGGRAAGDDDARGRAGVQRGARAQRVRDRVAALRDGRARPPAAAAPHLARRRGGRRGRAGRALQAGRAGDDGAGRALGDRRGGEPAGPDPPAAVGAPARVRRGGARARPRGGRALRGRRRARDALVLALHLQRRRLHAPLPVGSPRHGLAALRGREPRGGRDRGGGDRVGRVAPAARGARGARPRARLRRGRVRRHRRAGRGRRARGLARADAVLLPLLRADRPLARAPCGAAAGARAGGARAAAAVPRAGRAARVPRARDRLRVAAARKGAQVRRPPAERAARRPRAAGVRGHPGALEAGGPALRLGLPPRALRRVQARRRVEVRVHQHGGGLRPVRAAGA